LIQYKKIIDYLEFHDVKKEDGEEERKLIKAWNDLKLKGFTNLAACYNKLRRHKEAVDMCKEVRDGHASRVDFVFLDLIAILSTSSHYRFNIRLSLHHR